MQKSSQDKRTPDLADAMEKPQCGENPLMKSYYDSVVQQREGVQKSNRLAQYKVKSSLSNSTVKLQC